MHRLWTGLALIAVAAGAGYVWMRSNAGVTTHVVGNLRITALAPNLVRLEERGPNGFEDRPTFHVVERRWDGVRLRREDNPDGVLLRGDTFSIQLPSAPTTLANVKLLGPAQEVLHTFAPAAERAGDLPFPSQLPSVWLMPDAPRVVAPPWGATPPPADFPPSPTSGWDVANPARDVYAFLPQGNHAALLQTFVRLTGPIPIPPLYTFGSWTSRWHPYSETTALEEMDTFRSRGFPLDLFVVDTDWRVGASEGYGINTSFFPDMKRFVDAAHQRHIRLLFNDHPEPQGAALDAAELQYRWDGLTSLLNLGVDAWWYDRNWHTVLPQPAPGLRKEVWGMRLYQDITQRARPNQRPLIMSNADGIRSGQKVGPVDPAAHRFPIWWTGDTYADWPFLKLAVQNSINEGLLGATPYVHDDCGGHYFKATGELFTRFMQFCALSPVLRPHASQALSRLPWEFDPTTEDLVRRAILLRYRLLPTLYAAARRAFEDGTPLLRRLDLEWPTFAEAASPTQYLLGDDLMVAPVLEGLDAYNTLPETDVAMDGKPGVAVEMHRGKLDGEMLAQGTAPSVAYRGWPVRAEVPEGVAASWRTTWTVPDAGSWGIRLLADGMGKLWLDEVLVVDDSLAPNDVPAQVTFQAGQKVKVRVEVGPTPRAVTAIVLVAAPKDHKPAHKRPVWIPPGGWEDLWTGERLVGPRLLERTAPPEVVPLYARVGGAILTTREMMFTGEAPWDPMVVDAFVGDGAPVQHRWLYEDDGETNAYLQGSWRKTRVTVDGRTVRVDSAEGTFSGATATRRWVIRLHLPPGAAAASLRVNGKPCAQASGAVCREVPRSQGAPLTVLTTEGLAAPGAGPVLEASLDAMDATRAFTVSAE